MGITEEYFLTEPSKEYVEEILSYRREFEESDSSMDGTGELKKLSDPYEWIRLSKEGKNKETVIEGLVIATQFMYVRKKDNRIVGMIQLRHELNDHLREFGGHIGYSVRPSERRKGIAKRMLKNCLNFARELGLKEVLLTCGTGNEASRRTILANGGKYASTAKESDKKSFERYWISI